ncbi:MAG TPA: small ribosomal subunit Rsm22 family protein [Verrucomicrobiae bacterium]|nr:small ribosomal subunit Rsm22 family protein [Verrucomicrobiae bacterium]
MQLPPRIRRAIEERADDVGFPALKRAATELSEAYREGKSARLSGEDEITAYLATRMPATYAAARAVLGELRGMEIASVLDVGAGTGAAALAAREIFPNAEKVTLIERDPALAETALSFLPGAIAIHADLGRMTTLPAHDLVVAAWSLGEIPRAPAARLWEAARVALVVIEPGTPRGAAMIRQVREELLGAGAHMIAPCPAAMGCPLTEPDWCHFAERVERSSLHRRLKDGALGYEDEKYSYVALAREPFARGWARVLRRPQHHAGLIELRLCTPAGVEPVRVARRDRTAFRAARKAEWGGRYWTGA